ncbi:hypothetical protein AB0E08_41550 [Streptomyces sp. NPDC048281]|uniref:hypothetical protein n=1 Tax=Streptomyces sp. NPDC048281 TaxID=3154715 RepID=UPI003422AC96
MLGYAMAIGTLSPVTGAVAEGAEAVAGAVAEGAEAVVCEDFPGAIRPEPSTGQMHFQDQSNLGVKCRWDFQDGGFTGMLARQPVSNQAFQAAVNKGPGWLGEAP